MAKNLAQNFTNNESAEVFNKTALEHPVASNVTNLAPRPKVFGKLLNRPKKTDQKFITEIPDAVLYGPIAKNRKSWPEVLHELGWTTINELNYQSHRNKAEQAGRPIPPRFDAANETDFKGRPFPRPKAPVRSEKAAAVQCNDADDQGVGQMQVDASHQDALEKQSAQEVFADELEAEELDLSERTLPTVYPTAAFGAHANAVRAIASHLQVAESMVGSILLVIVAALAQAFIGVSAYAGGRGISVSLFLMIIAESGERKSSTIEVMLRPVLAILRKATDQRQQLVLGDPTVDGTIIGLIRRCPVQLLLAPLRRHTDFRVFRGSDQPSSRQGIRVRRRPPSECRDRCARNHCNRLSFQRFCDATGAGKPLHLRQARVEDGQSHAFAHRSSTK